MNSRVQSNSIVSKTNVLQSRVSNQPCIVQSIHQPSKVQSIQPTLYNLEYLTNPLESRLSNQRSRVQSIQPTLQSPEYPTNPLKSRVSNQPSKVQSIQPNLQSLNYHKKNPPEFTVSKQHSKSLEYPTNPLESEVPTILVIRLKDDT